MASTRLSELVQRVQVNTGKVNDYLEAHGLPAPSFDEHGPVDLQLNSKEVAEARIAAMEAALELHDLLLGPAMCLRPVVSTLPSQPFHAARCSDTILPAQCY